MNFHRFFLKTANSLVSLVVILFLTVAGVYSGYALWDNAQVYAAVDDVQSELLKLKPDVSEEDGASFEELLAINPDVCAWLTLDNTGIDYPVVQGEDNLSYINTYRYAERLFACPCLCAGTCDRKRICLSDRLASLSSGRKGCWHRIREETVGGSSRR